MDANGKESNCRNAFKSIYLRFSPNSLAHIRSVIDFENCSATNNGGIDQQTIKGWLLLAVLVPVQLDVDAQFHVTKTSYLQFHWQCCRTTHNLCGRCWQLKMANVRCLWMAQRKNKKSIPPAAEIRWFSIPLPSSPSLSLKHKNTLFYRSTTIILHFNFDLAWNSGDRSAIIAIIISLLHTINGLIYDLWKL